jgi:ABC-2 type transport system permease protein
MNQHINVNMIKKLVLKDLHLTRKVIAMYMGGAILALSFINLGEAAFYMASVLLICMLIGLGNHQIAITIIGERKEQTLPFIMSLPISPTDYAIGKLISNISIFLIPWLIILLALITVLIATDLPNGLIPYSVIFCTFFLVNYFITWAVGMAIESEGAIIFVMVFLNCLTSPVMYVLGKTPALMNNIQGKEALWNSTSIGILAAEIALALLVLAIAFFIQSRKKTFL